MKRNRVHPAVALVLLLPALLVMTGMGSQDQEIGAIGATVEQFSLPTYDGKTFTHEDLEQKVTLIVFWYPT
jgi:cytochrome oxidase Cu insertion factor (SCO1/SenC/PrrC family)